MDSNDVRRQWAELSGAYSPEYYAYYGPDETSDRIRALLKNHLDRDAAVLEVGCSSGRHLAHLHDDGFENLHGVEINGEALDVMADVYPGLAADGTFHVDDIGEVVTAFDDDAFDAAYSVETLQHIHPDDDRVFDELARVTGDLLITVENEASTDGRERSGPEVTYVEEGIPLYHRDWNRIFTDRDCEEVVAEPGERDTLRAFRPPID